MTPTWSGVTKALSNAQDWQGMVAHCRRWIQTEPDNDYAWYSLSLACVRLGLYPEAIEALREALRLNPDDARAWYNLGNANRELARYPEAIEAYRLATLLIPDFADAWNNLGVTYAKSGNCSAALEAAKEMRRYDPLGAEKLFNILINP